MGTLFELTNEFRALYELMTEPDTDEQIISDTLEGLKGELEVKGAGYVSVINQLQMEADKADELSKAFKAKADTRKNNINRMKDMLKTAMSEIGTNTIEAGDYTIKLQKNGGKQPMIVDGEVPNDYLKVIYEQDKDKIRKALEDGEELSFAHLEERGKHIVIK